MDRRGRVPLPGRPIPPKRTRGRRSGPPLRDPSPSTAKQRSTVIQALSIPLAVLAVVSSAGHAEGGRADVSPSDRVSVRFSTEGSKTGLPDGSVFVLLLPSTRPSAELPGLGPWWDRPHPFGVVDVENPALGEIVDLSLEVDVEATPSDALQALRAASESAASEEGAGSETIAQRLPGAVAPRWYPDGPESLAGRFRVQAVFRPESDPTPGGAGEWRSGVVEVELADDRQDRIELVLEPPPTPSAIARRVVGQDPPPDWIEVEMPSPMLERAGGVSPRHRAWVVFPRGYHDLRASRRLWPTVYVVPHAGDGRAEAEALRDAIAIERTREAMPQAVWVVIDPTSPWGHHHFADSGIHGPRETALLEEFVPELERRHRLVPEAEARLLLGHGAGGWTVLRLLLDHPDRFAKAFATSPELVDLSRLGWLDAYGLDAFADEQGRPRPAYREIVGERETAVRTVMEQEWSMAETASPEGRSGNRWHRWAALASPPRVPGDRPPPLFDGNGRIDRRLAETRWLPLDLAAALVREPARLIPLWTGRIHVWVGSLDEAGQDRGLLSLQKLLSELAVGLDLPRPERSVVSLVSGATFESVVPNSRIAVYREMIRHLRAHDLAD